MDPETRPTFDVDYRIQVVACFTLAWCLLGGSLENAWNRPSRPDVDVHLLLLLLAPLLIGLFLSPSLSLSLFPLFSIPVLLGCCSEILRESTRANL